MACDPDVQAVASKRVESTEISAEKTFQTAFSSFYPDVVLFDPNGDALTQLANVTSARVAVYENGCFDGVYAWPQRSTLLVSTQTRFVLLLSPSKSHQTQISSDVKCQDPELNLCDINTRWSIFRIVRSPHDPSRCVWALSIENVLHDSLRDWCVAFMDEAFRVKHARMTMTFAKMTFDA